MIKIKEKTEENVLLELNNGHKKALDKIVADYNLKGISEALSFMLSIFSEADGKAINNGKGLFVPSDSLKKQ